MRETSPGAASAPPAGVLPTTTGTLQADATVSAGALALDGNGDYLQFGNDVADLRPAGASLSIAAWVNTNSAVSSLRRIFEHEDNLYFWAEGGIFQYTTHGTPGGTTGRAQSATAPTVGAWQHMLVTLSAGGPATIYIDGVMEGFSSTPQAPIPGNVQTLQIGARRGGSGAASNFWDGLIDDVAVWEGLLSPGEIEALAGVGNGGYAGRTTPTLVPEPSPTLLLSLCSLGLLLRRRRANAAAVLIDSPRSSFSPS